MAVDKKADEKKIRELDVQWGDAACKKDLRAVVSFYASDGSLVWQGNPAAHGTAAIRANWKKMIKTAGLKLRFIPKRIVVAAAGDLATDFGVVEIGQDTDKGPTTVKAKYLVVWKKSRGTWKVLYDSYNTNN